MGDSLSESIDAGLAESRFGVIVISKHFLGKPWPKRELRGLVSRELAFGGKVLLPVRHEIAKEDLMAISPPLADVLAVSTSRGIGRVTEKILEVQLQPGAKVGIAVESGRLVVEPRARRRYTLDELLAQCDPKARRSKQNSKQEREWLNSKPVGRELI